MLMGGIRNETYSLQLQEAGPEHGNVSLAVKSVPVFSKYFIMRDEYLT